MSLNYKTFASTYAYYLVLMRDYEKASLFLFDMIEISFKNDENDEYDVDDIKQFVIDIVSLISEYDADYSEKMARKYYRLIMDQNSTI
tara:strand:- start:2182 stop:2445 length:264 start_codon:yes stop_codon:yes gene_type:complete